MDRLNIAICEDNPDEVEKLLVLVQKNSIPTRFTVFSSGESLLEIYQPSTFDLLLLDIYMDGITGIEAATKIREVDVDVPLAFITTSLEHTLESYRLSALKYIEKPICEKDIEDILQLALLKKNSAPSLEIHKNRKIEQIKFSNILYLEQQKHQIHIYLKNGNIVRFYDKLSSLLSQLEEHCFFHSHKSFCVNLAFVSIIDPELRCFVMQNGQNVPIRRESVSKAKKAYEDFLFKKTRRPNL